MMKADRKSGKVVGVLFILATAFSLASSSITGLGPLQGASNYLTTVSSNPNQIVLGVLLLLAAAGSIVLIPAALFPVLKRHSESIALGYFGIRTLEAVTMVIDSVSLLMLVSTAQQYAKATGPLASAFQASGALWFAVNTWMLALDPIIFGAGGLMLYYLLYTNRLIPRWLSAWGAIGVTLVMAFGTMQLFGSGPVYLAAPIAVQEMAMAVWLILRGFNPTTIAPAQGN